MASAACKVRRSVAEIDGENDDGEKGGILLIIVYNYNINFFFQEDGISINGCFSASLAEIRFEGSKRKHLCNKSIS